MNRGKIKFLNKNSGTTEENLREEHFIAEPMPSGSEVRTTPFWAKGTVKLKVDVCPRDPF